MNNNEQYKETKEKERERVNQRDEDGYTLLHIVKSAKEAKELVESGANIEAKDNYDWTPLHWAAANGNKEVAEVLLNAGANVNAIDDEGNTPLHLTADNKNKEVAELLLQKGAIKDARNKYVGGVSANRRNFREWI